jgi:hypothetical protein
MTRFPCPYLHSEVDLTDEREQHIAESHPDLLPEHRDLLAQALSDPDQVRLSRRFGNARLFSRWFDTLREGKHVVVVVVSDAAANGRHWLITAYIARKLAQGDVEWTRS